MSWGWMLGDLVSASRQISVGLNMTHYAAPDQPDPISAALGQLLVQELCPGSFLRQAFTWRSPVHANNSW
ncbi:MAG TPA: hypothetical protein VFC19_27920 [Candidatus Limnocylindrales bacterium]|nr:hypothetical protein [Candidatus Limnocylindrales bacterium]